jgi:hypothetical protein
MSGAALALAAALFFDDFSQPDLDALRRAGWVLRSAAGHPGPVGARWEPSLLGLLDDPAQGGNRLLRLRAATDGSAAGTQQSQLCHRRQYLEGSYAARVRFVNTPAHGVDGDPVIQAHYLISPLRHDLDPDFSEVDFEYLANGGWGSAQTRLYAINWQTVQIEPWRSFNQAHERPGALEGWHVLAMQIGAGRTRLYLDGELLAEHGGRAQPVQPMSLNFSLWFSPGGLLGPEAGLRVWEQDVDWVFHAQGELLSPAQMLERVAALRAQGVQQLDTIRPPEPPLTSPCDL